MPVRFPITRRQLNVIGLLACVAMMAFALFVQYGLRLTPCNMCILQRGGVIGVGAAFLLAALHDPGRTGARLYGLLITVTAVAAAGLSARHVWMQMQPPGSLPSCGADFYTMVDMLPLFEVVTKILNGGGECQAITASFLGLSMPAWTLVAIAGLGIAGLAGNWVLGPDARTLR